MKKRTLQNAETTSSEKVWYIKFLDYLFHIIINICYSKLGNSRHGVCLSTACLSICKNSSWNLCPSFRHKENCQWYSIEIQQLEKRRSKAKEGILTVNTADNRKSNFLGSFFIHLLCGAITPKYSVWQHNERSGSVSKK